MPSAGPMKPPELRKRKGEPPGARGYCGVRSMSGQQHTSLEKTIWPSKGRYFSRISSTEASMHTS